MALSAVAKPKASVAAQVAYTATVNLLRVYMAGDIPPGLFPEQYDGIRILNDPTPPQVTTFE